MNIYSLTHHIEEWLEKKSAKLGKDLGLHQPQSKASKYLNKAKPPFMLALAILSLTAVLGNRFYNQPELDEGTIAPRTYIAPGYRSVVDTEETDKLRKQARDATIPVLKKDLKISDEIITNIQEYLNQIKILRTSVGKFPFIADLSLISAESQLYLRQSSDSEWESILEKVDNLEKPKVKLNESEELNPQKEQIIAKLQYYRKKMTPQEYQSLLQKIRQARIKYQLAWQVFSQNQNLPSTNQNLPLTEAEKRTILELSDEIWQKTENLIRKTTRKIITQGIPQGIPESLIEETINIHLGIGNDQANSLLEETEIPEEAKSLASSIIRKFIQPNLKIDAQETAKRAERDAEAIAEQIIYIKKDEIIVEQGKEITHQQFLKLDEFGLSKRGVNWQGIGQAGIVATGAVLIIWISQQKAKLPFRCSDQVLLCLLTLSAPALAIAGIPYTSLPAVGLLSSTFYGPTVALTQVGVSTVLVIYADEFTEGKDWEPLATGVVGGIMAAMIARRLSDRDKLAQLGVGIGLVQLLVYFIVKLIFTSSPASIWFPSLQQGLTYGLFSGLGWSVVALGISPYLERLFGLLTPSRLAELSNINQPLLKQLAELAPGTWQHTLYVASLAEGAARKLNCNVELIRAGTLYHDIGKLHDPLSFIENQMGGPNNHEEINDPWKSAAIIKKHVSYGLVLARRHELPKAIADFIPQHQGTMLIAYFYFQAKKQAEENPELEVYESDFRYNGPIPQSREAGIMMLADSSEAALRSLDNATRQQALVMISKILKARWQDNQLVDSGLEYEELPIIAQVFVDVWEQSKHRRIAYPKGALEAQKK